MLGESRGRPTAKKQFKSKKYFKENKLSGLYQQFDPYTDELREEGNFRDGVETGKWRVIDEDGDEIHYEYSLVRVGARCGDGTTSSATGRGACSWHGGVAEWLYGAQKAQVGGTGKYMPQDQRVQALRDKAKARFKITKSGLDLEEELLKLLFALADKGEKLGKELLAVKEELEGANEELDEMQAELEKARAKEKEKGKEREEKKPIIVNNFIQSKNEKTADKASKDKLEAAKPSPSKSSAEKEKEKEKEEPEKKEAARLPNPYEQEDDPDWQDYDEEDEESEEEETADQQYSLIHDLLARMNLK